MLSVCLTLALSLTPPQVVDAGPMEHPATMSTGPEFEIQALVLSPTKRSYRMSVRSHATKDVRSMVIETRAGSRVLGVNIKTGEDGAALFPAGKLMETSIFLQPTQRPDTIAITTVLWMDGTITGPPRQAIDRILFDRADAIQVERIVEFLRTAIASSTADPLAAFAAYGAGVTDLNVELTPAVLDRVRERPLPSDARITDAELMSIVGVSLKAIKRAALDNFVSFKTDLTMRPSHPAGVELMFLKQELARYEAYLGNLKQFPR